MRRLLSIFLVLWAVLSLSPVLRAMPTMQIGSPSASYWEHQTDHCQLDFTSYDANCYPASSPNDRFEDGPNTYDYVCQNPWTKFDPEGLAAADPSTDGTQTMADTVNQVTTDMKKQNWAPENSANPGAFGSEVHDRVSNALKGKDGWAVNVTFDTKTKKVLAVGEELAGSKVGTTQVDALYLAKGYSLKVGETLDASKVVNLFELKTSLLGKVGTDQAERLSGLIGRDFETVKSPIRWTASAGWSENPAFSIGAKAMAVLPLAFAAYAYVHQSNYDYQLDDFRSAVMQAKNADANERQVDQIIAIQKGSAYLSNFIPDTALDAATLGAIYKTIGDKK